MWDAGFMKYLTDICSGAWKNVSLKPYNFNAKGALTPSGALHPCTLTQQILLLADLFG